MPEHRVGVSVALLIAVAVGGVKALRLSSANRRDF